jgi:hypothetical protein
MERQKGRCVTVRLHGAQRERASPSITLPDEARAELATAVAMLRDMGMAFWLPEAERELGGARR